ncbi:glycosyltransferase [Swingsia samuiensis]|uniref:Glycosyltransferase family 2 protein n=1 Tax=Swingsia samuiensis TaxID=1293412 RepID=A0A4Y6UGX1_9PROT|nr:glycosyltransferase family 2 protein [Swingsia samuiensis]QDH16244.1 glycosyltransferase family 2 protein [Swingsia samuiensis]
MQPVSQLCLPARLSIIVPCYNEVDNVEPLIRALDQALKDEFWEVVFVDDNSPDGTADRVAGIAAYDPRVRVLQRVGRRGLSSAVIEGFLASSAVYVAVMDGDLQHDESILPKMIADLDAGADVVVASRHIEGGDNAGLAGKWRHFLSDAGIKAAQKVMVHQLSDPMSGFFALKRSFFKAQLPHLSGAGFKILVDLMMSAPKTTVVVEEAFVFRPRLAGESKLNIVVLLQFATMLMDKLTHGYLPTRFIAFGAVGLVGIIVNVCVMRLAGDLGFAFSKAQLIGTAVAILTNFWLNNHITYYDRRLKGSRFWGGLILFVLVCSLGAIGNIGVAQMVLHTVGHGHLDRSSAAGAVIGVVWNYAVSSTLIWR